MNIRTFWLIVIKVIGFWLLVQGFPVMMQGLTQVFSSSASVVEQFESVVIIIGTTFLGYGFVTWLFLFKSVWLLDLLKLERGFPEDRILENTKYSVLFRIAVIICGALLLLNSLPEFCVSLFTFLQQDILFNEFRDADTIIYYAIRSLAGYLIMTNSLFITRSMQIRDE